MKSIDDLLLKISDKSHEAVDYVIDSVQNSKKLNKGLVYMTLSGIGANIISSYIINQGGGNSETGHNISYWSEAVVGSTVFIGNYSYNRFKQGASKKQVANELLRIGITAFSISYPLYRPARSELSTLMEQQGIISYLATPLSQLILLIPFGFALDMLGKPMNYLMTKSQKVKDRMMDATKTYMNGNGNTRNNKENNNSK